MGLRWRAAAVRLGLRDGDDSTARAAPLKTRSMMSRGMQRGVVVSSLMFAAARFSDLLELRDLKISFQDKYGNSLQYFVNQQVILSYELNYEVSDFAREHQSSQKSGISRVRF